MTDTMVRVGEKQFYDDKNFPRGFAKSGNFTIMEEELLLNYGDTLSSLAKGKLTPENDDEKHFLKVIKGTKKAKTKLEQVWVKYQKYANGHNVFYSLNSSKKSDPASSSWKDDYVDPELDLESTSDLED